MRQPAAVMSFFLFRAVLLSGRCMAITLAPDRLRAAAVGDPAVGFAREFFSLTISEYYRSKDMVSSISLMNRHLTAYPDGVTIAKTIQEASI